MYIISKGHNGDWWCLSKKGHEPDWWWYFSYQRVKKKAKNTVSSKALQPGQEKMDVWAFFLLDWKVSIHELKNSPTSSLFWWWIWNLDMAGDGKSAVRGNSNLFSVCLYFCIFLCFHRRPEQTLLAWVAGERWKVASRDIWPFLLPGQLLFSQTYVSILFRFFSWFFSLTLSSYHTFPLNCSSNQHFSIFLGGASNHPARL